MPSNKRETYNELATYKDYVSGKTKFPNGILQDCTQVFRDYGWRMCTPYDNSGPNMEKLGEISTFFNQYDGFITEANDFTDMYALYKNDARG